MAHMLVAKMELCEGSCGVDQGTLLDTWPFGPSPCFMTKSQLKEFVVHMPYSDSIRDMVYGLAGCIWLLGIWKRSAYSFARILTIMADIYTKTHAACFPDEGPWVKSEHATRVGASARPKLTYCTTCRHRSHRTLRPCR